MLLTLLGGWNAGSRVNQAKHTQRRGARRRRAAGRWLLERLEDRTLLSAATLPDDISGWWPGDGNASDIVGGNNGSLAGGTAFVAGEVNQAFSFDGNNDEVNIGSTFPFHQPGDGTLEFWLKFPPTAHQSVFWTRSDNTDTNRYNFFVNADSTFGFDYRSPSGALHVLVGQCCTGISIPANTWTHLAIARAGNVYSVYRNGTLAATATDKNPDLPTAVGWQFSGRSSYIYKGLLDEVSLYQRALLASEIQAIASAGTAGKTHPMTVTTTTPASGSIVSTAPTDFAVNFLHAYNQSTVQPSDLTVNSVAADSVQFTDANTATFHFNTSPVVAQGLQTMHMAAGSVTAANAGLAEPLLREWTKTFRYDTIRMAVSSTAPAAGSPIVITPGTLEINLNEAYDAASIGVDDLSLSRGTVTGFTLVDADTVRYTIDGLTEGTVTVSIPAGAIADPTGGPILSYSASYAVDIGVVPFSGVFNLKDPAGSLVYQGSSGAQFGTASDLDNFTLDLDANQTLSIRVASSAVATLTLDHSVLGSIPLPADEDSGTGRLYQTVRFENAGVPVAGTVTIGVQAPSDLAAATSYSLQLTLNARVDASTGSAPVTQSLAGSTLDVNPGSAVIDRSAALGSVEKPIARILQETEGVTGDLRGSWDQLGATTTWAINNSGNPNTAVNKGVTGSLNTKGNNNDASDPWRFDGRAGDVVTIRTRGSNSGGGTLSATTLTLQHPSGTQTVGVAVSGAASDKQIQSLTLSQTGTYTISVGTGNNKQGTYTLTVDLTTPSDPRFRPEDINTIDVAAAGFITLSAATGSGVVSQPRVNLALYAPGVDPFNETPLATSTAAGTLDAFIEVNASVTGTYKVKVSADSSATGTQNYGLVVTGGGAFERAGANGDFASAQDVTGRAGVLGSIERTISKFVPSGSGGLNRSIGIAFGPDINGDTVPEVYVSSFNSDEVMRYNGVTGAPLGIAGNPTSAVFVTRALGGLDNPEFLTFGPDGNLYVVSSPTNQVFRYNSTTGALINVFVTASNNGGLAHPLAAVFGPDGNLYVTGSDSDNVIRYNGATGAFMNVFVSAGSGGLNRPEVLTFGPDGNLYVSSSLTNQVLRYSGTTGAFLDAFVPAGSGGLNFPTGLTFGSDGHLYVGSANNDRVLRYHGTTGAFLDNVVPAGAGGLDRPTGLAFGADARLYVTTADTSEVLRVTMDPSPDFYKVTLSAGQTLTVTSSTPADGSGQFANNLDPILELYDATFTLVASGTTLADGRNEQVQWTAASGGVIYIKIGSGNMSRGEYVLDVLVDVI
jgi:hypothetical protein